MNVWLVEDDDLVAIPFTMWIERLGHVVEHYRRASEALDALDAETPDLLITDLTLPGMNGRDLIEQFQARVSGVPVILMSGHNVNIEELNLAQPLVFLPKPVDLERLGELLARFAGAQH